jgi:hypothetical protein
MAQFTKKSASGTSFHGTTLKATPQQLINLFPMSYHEQNDGRDKTNFDFTLVTESGDVFTIYDWKEYRPLRMDEVVEWHVGAVNASVSEQAKQEVMALLK